ncbi:hypothetical protein Nocox_33990 [Nonomuraea coxensis DSM 45129]|uniref:DUF418 domain-containing protein n=1 Tax=Nonomuraea coxensis DSM 45129 TaxID=1122611 RepID=A0ABX8U9C5_9ACTN|nr:DUF418 domain-containing protein [Nonomuraea coxensis]QYC44365.1 hypothetical protein Nocox_33990 [Nonomuraea coxensis DSM 45129]
MRSHQSHPTILDAPPGTGKGARIASVDALRGFALLGILVVNIAFLASGYRMAGHAEPAFQGPLDWGVRWSVTLFLENKFYLLFSFLFGYSFTLQLDSAARQGLRFTPMFLRRLGGLFLLGLAHAVLLFPGDILTTYAAVGVALLVLRRITPKAAVVLAVGLTALLALAFVLLAVLTSTGLDMSHTVADTAAEAARSDQALVGGVWQIITEHVRKLSLILVLRVFFQGPAVLAACLIGLAVGKLGLLRDLSAHQDTLRRLQWIGFTVGLSGALFYTASAWTGAVHKFWGEAVDLVTAPLLAAAYAATFLRLLPHLPGLGRVLAAPGRMALSNYLAQSLICSLIFTGYGLALVDRVSPPLEVAIACGVFAVQVLASQWWLGRHRYGPVEWWLRHLTYWRRPAGAVIPPPGG